MKRNEVGNFYYVKEIQIHKKSERWFLFLNCEFERRFKGP